MESGSDKVGPKLDEQMKNETEPIERSKKEARVEGHREQQGATDDEPSTGERISGSGSSAEHYTYKDHGEEGGASHPKPPERR